MRWGVVFHMRWGSFLSDGVPLGMGIGFGGGIFEKNRKMVGGGGGDAMGNPTCGHYFVQYRFI